MHSNWNARSVLSWSCPQTTWTLGSIADMQPLSASRPGGVGACSGGDSGHRLSAHLSGCVLEACTEGCNCSCHPVLHQSMDL